MDLYNKTEDWLDKNFEFGKGTIIGFFAGMGLTGVAMPVAPEIILETPVRAIYDSMKKVEDYYSKFSEKINNC